MPKYRIKMKKPKKPVSAWLSVDEDKSINAGVNVNLNVEDKVKKALKRLGIQK